jgi:exodeoxyribonuclease V alpha subunit
MSAHDTIARLEQRGVLSALDVQLASVLRRIVGEQSSEVLLGAALASRAVQRGHVCADLKRLSRLPLLDADDVPVTDVSLPRLGTWLTALSASKLVSAGDQRTPLVIDDAGRLYLYRYFDYQRRLAARLRQSAKREVVVDDALLRDGLNRLFSAARATDEQDAQRLAAIVACRRRFTVVSGGPGTGKTTTVVKILALLQELALATGPPLRILLLAPTGKAARRLAESIERSVPSLNVAQRVKDAIPRNASTIHRALGFQPRTPTRFRHGADSPLGADVVLADEASMIDLALMTKLVEAVPSHARLILLGDKDQLASVEAGAILGDIFDTDTHAGYSAEFAREVEQLTGLPVATCEDGPAISDCLVELTKSYRYDEHSGIGALARAVNDGDPDRALSILEGEAAMPYGEVAIASVDEQHPLSGSLGTAVIDGFRSFLEADTPNEKLEALTSFRILCAHRRGPFGVETLNGLVEQHLQRAGLLSLDGPYYEGRPIMITRNDHQLGLFNGDVGVIVRPPGQAPMAWLAGAHPSHGSPRSFPPSRLPPHETVFAMTVHKSQGSEFDRVALLLPSRVSPLLTRELVYTGISRARRRVDVHGAEHVLRHAIARGIERASGLRDALWSE